MRLPIDPTDKTFLDVASVLTVTGALFDMLPAVAAVFTIVWTGIRIYETETVQRWFEKTKKPHDPEGPQG